MFECRPSGKSRPPYLVEFYCRCHLASTYALSTFNNVYRAEQHHPNSIKRYKRDLFLSFAINMDKWSNLSISQHHYWDFKLEREYSITLFFPFGWECCGDIKDDRFFRKFTYFNWIWLDFKHDAPSSISHPFREFVRSFHH